MFWQGKTFANNRQRRILGFSPFEETPRRLLVELNEARTDYEVQNEGDDDPDHNSRDMQIIQGLLEAASEPLTRREILSLWPEDHPLPDDATLWRWLDRAVKQGLLVQEGSGRRGSAFRYGVGR